MTARIITLFKRGILCIALLSGFAATTYPQVFPFQFYTTKDGLVANAITSLYQDSFGYLWIGTPEGISVYDGTSFKNYTLTDGLPNSYINLILEHRTRPGVMWIATNGGGLCRWDRGKITVIKLGARDAANRVNDVFEDTGGALWCATDGGMFVVRGDSVRALFPDSAFELVTAVRGLTDSTIVFTLDRRLYECRMASLELRELPLPPQPDVAINRITVVGPAELWAATSRGQLHHIKDWSIVRSVDLPGGPFTTFMMWDHEDILWLTSSNGIYRVQLPGADSVSVTRYGTANGLPERSIAIVYEDAENSLWFGGTTNGLCKLRDRNVVRFPLLRPNSVTADACVVVDVNNHFWILAERGLQELWRTPQESWNTRHHIFAAADSLDPPLSVNYDRTSNGIWVRFATNRLEFHGIQVNGDGSSRLVKQRTLVPGVDFPRGLGLPQVAIKDSRRLLCSIIDVGVVELDLVEGTTRVFDLKDGLDELYVRAICRDRRGNLWFGQYNLGLVKIEGVDSPQTNVTHYTTRNGLADNSVRVIFEDHLGRIWIGTRYGGLTIIEGDSLRTITVREGLLSNGVWSITEDGEGTVWLSTHNGLQSITLDSTPELVTYDFTLGSVTPSCRVSSDGLVCAVQINDCLILDLNRTLAVLPPPPVYITSINVNGEEAGSMENLNFSSTQTNVAVEFVGISFASGLKMRYRHKLEETDREWSPPTAQHSIAFASLSPGHYRFLVKAINADGVESVTPAIVQFTIAQPFWRQWWFIALCFLTIAMALYSVHRLRVKRLLEIENVRRRIASDLHDDVGADLTQIAIFSEILKSHLRDGSGQEMLEKIGTTARRVIAGMSDLVWYIDPRHDTVDDLVARVEDLAGQLLRAKEISLTVEIEPAAKSLSLSPDTRRELFLIIKEALHNAVRHASCSAISFRLSATGGRLGVCIEDNGRGISPDAVRGGHGLQNMKNRVEGLGGQFVLNSVPGGGTALKLDVPLSAQSRQTT